MNSIWPWKRTKLASQLWGLRTRKCLAPNDAHTLALKLASSPARIIHDIFPKRGKSMQINCGSQAQERRIAPPAALTVLADLGHPWTSTPWFSFLRTAFAISRFPSIAQDPSYPPTDWLPRVHIPPNHLSLCYSHSSQIITILPTKTRKSLGRQSKKKKKKRGCPLVWIKSVISNQPDVPTHLP